MARNRDVDRMSDDRPRNDRDSGPPRPVPSRGRRTLFILICLLAPVLLLALLEGSFRLGGYGGYPPTIVEVGPRDEGVVCITDTPGPASYFFANRDKPGSINTYTFLKPKPKGTVRIFLAGESAAKGFPQPMCFAPSAFLEAMLQDAWGEERPERRVEVINLGTTAVASFPVLGILTEALDYKPDLVVIHCGNNEFFGAYGVASLHRAAGTPGMMALHRALRRSALVQWMDGLRTPKSPDGPAGGRSMTLMELMMGQGYTGPDDPIRAAAARNLRTHVGEMIARCRARDVPAMVCTLACNERDMAPLGDADDSSLPPDVRERRAELLAEGEAKLAADAAAALGRLEEAARLLPDDGRAHHFIGRARLALGREKEALASFQRAVDLDPMPWRCPSACTAALREAAASGGAVVCDLQGAFRAASPGGCVGWELMDDHVHPTLEGQALTARTIVEAMTRLEGPLKVSQESFDRLPSDAEYLKRLGDNPYDRYGVACTMRDLSAIPFIKRTNPGAFDRFDARCREQERVMPAEVLTVCRKWQNPATHPGAKRPITGMVGRVKIRENRFDEAEHLYEIARRSVAYYSSWNLEYNYFMLVSRERVHGRMSDEDRALARECIERGRFLLSHGHSESGMAERYVGRLHQLRGEWAEAVPFLLASRPKVTGSDLVAVDQALVMSYLRTGRQAEAVRLVQQGIDHSGQYAELYRRMMTGIERAEGDSGSDGGTSPNP